LGRAWEEFRGLYLALYAALLPDKTDETAVDVFERTVLHVWAMKQEMMRWAASRAKREAFFAETGGLFPAPLQLLIKRPGWRVRVWSGCDGEGARAAAPPAAGCRGVRAGKRVGRPCTWG
jgi:hypothetical protein